MATTAEVILGSRKDILILKEGFSHKICADLFEGVKNNENLGKKGTCCATLIRIPASSVPLFGLLANHIVI